MNQRLYLDTDIKQHSGFNVFSDGLVTAMCFMMMMMMIMMQRQMVALISAIRMPLGLLSANRVPLKLIAVGEGRDLSPWLQHFVKEVHHLPFIMLKS